MRDARCHACADASTRFCRHHVQNGCCRLICTPRSTRSSQQPLSLPEEREAADALSTLEQRDVAAVLRLSLAGS